VGRQRTPGESRSSRGLVAGIAGLIAAAAVAFVLYRTGFIVPQQVSAEDLNRVLLVAASPDDTGAAVAQIIVIIDLTISPAALEPVSPALPVTIPGTSYSALGDAYPFGGGSGTAVALAAARGEDPLPYVVITPEQLSDAVGAEDGVSVALPAAMSVFDGEDLYTFRAGAQTLTAAELQAVLKGAPYLTKAQREDLDAALAEMLVEVLASPGGLDGVQADLDGDARERLGIALQGFAR